MKFAYFMLVFVDITLPLEEQTQQNHIIPIIPCHIPSRGLHGQSRTLTSHAVELISGGGLINLIERDALHSMPQVAASHARGARSADVHRGSW